MKKSQVDQLKLFAGFLKSDASMLKALKNLNWKEFAKLYYGPSTADQYAKKLLDEYANQKHQSKQ
jgi:hypothetical protein